jgi:hypothetical protein
MWFDPKESRWKEGPDPAFMPKPPEPTIVKQPELPKGSTGYEWHGSTVTEAEFKGLQQEAQQQIKKQGYYEIQPLLSKKQEVAIKYAVGRVEQSETEDIRSHWVSQIEQSGGKILKGSELIKQGYNVDPNQDYVVTTKTMIETKPSISKTVEEKPEETLQKIKEGKYYAYVKIPNEITKKYAPIDWWGKAKETGNFEVNIASSMEELQNIAKEPDITIGVLRPDQFNVEKGELKAHQLPIYTENKIRQEQLEAFSKRQGIRQAYEELPTWKKGFVAVRMGLTDFGVVGELTYLKAMGETEKFEERLTDVIVQQAEWEEKARQVTPVKVKLGKFEYIINKPNVEEPIMTALTRGVGLTQIMKPVGLGLQTGINVVTSASRIGGTILSAGLASVGVGTTAYMVKKNIERGTPEKIVGEAVVMTAGILGAIEGSYVAKQLGLGMKKPTIEVEKAVLRSVKSEQQGKITRIGETQLQVKVNNEMVEEPVKAELIGEETKGVGGLRRTKYYYYVPEQEVGDITIKEQKIGIRTQDFAKIEQTIAENMKYSKTLQTGAKITLPEKELEVSMKTIDEIITKQQEGAVTRFSKVGRVEDIEAYIEKGVATQKGTLAKGVMAKPETDYTYYFIEKNLPSTTTTKGFIEPVVRSSGGGVGSAVDTALERMETLRQLQEVQVEASINTGNVGRIIPSMLPTKAKGKEEKVDVGERIDRIVDMATEQITEPVRKQETFLVPTSISRQALQQRDLVQQSLRTPSKSLEEIVANQQQIVDQAVGTMQTKKVEQQVKQAVILTPRINLPETVKIPLEETITIGRPTRIVLPFILPSLRMKWGRGKTLDTYLKQVEHKMIEAMKLI